MRRTILIAMLVGVAGPANAQFLSPNAPGPTLGNLSGGPTLGSPTTGPVIAQPAPSAPPSASPPMPALPSATPLTPGVTPPSLAAPTEK